MPDDIELKTLAEAVEKAPDDHRSWYDLATLVDKMADDPEESSFYYMKAISISPFKLHYHVGLVTLWIDSGHDSLAEETLDIAFDLLRDPEGVDNSTVLALCAEAALHALHALNLPLTRSIIERIPPADLKKNSDLLRATFAYAELHMAKLELESSFHTDRKLIHAMQLPSTRLNPARYYRGETTDEI